MIRKDTHMSLASGAHEHTRRVCERASEGKSPGGCEDRLRVECTPQPHAESEAEGSLLAQDRTLNCAHLGIALRNQA